jgi:hypothetical protein
MTKAGLKAIAQAYNQDEKFIIPSDILNTLKSDGQIWKNFQSFPESYKRIRIAYIEYARTRSDQEF